jgi:hypothetical protein
MAKWHLIKQYLEALSQPANSMERLLCGSASPIDLPFPLTRLPDPLDLWPFIMVATYFLSVHLQVEDSVRLEKCHLPCHLKLSAGNPIQGAVPG